MKKIFISLMLLMSVGTATFATNAANGNERDNTTVEELKQKVANAPSGTTYGVTERKNGNIVVNTPFGKYTLERAGDGSYSFMGIKAKLISSKNGLYTVRTSLGTWVVNPKKCTVTKK